ncbi:TonB-dependent receptor [Pelomonas sp. SE-A7]|uniref:TonB-dependent receptor n=1 Tax=Pelomonas sp. SE-A7 TaxID=3054953 RepID=UPI00259CC5FD|nr:TonB-dependent receptor [Pelomonas sp. SE-A7]MDM4768435.1 TonB-dependent receptor [Pelomonas sp. SE-A7]
MQRRPRFACRPLALAALLAVHAQLSAQTPGEAAKPQSIDIPAQPAAQALQTLVKQHSFQLLYAPDLLKGISTKQVSGVMSPREALTRMLEGSGLQIVETGPNAATLRQAAAPAPRASAPQGGANAVGEATEPEADPVPKTSTAANSAAAVRVHKFDLAAGDAVETVRQVAELAGVVVKFKSEELHGIRTNRISGDFSFMQAMQELLRNTRLTLGQVVASGEFVVRKVEVIAPVEITGSHLRSIVGEQGINQVEVLTRQDIERSGVTTLAELRNLIPQLSVGASASFDGNSSRSAPDGRLLFNLRGLGQGNALILIDGLRLPRTGSRSVAEAYEATGIPMSAIERVEVLLGGGSAIYGADAVGGVINIITRKRYRGTEFEYALDNTLVTDAANNRVSLSHAYRHEKFSARGSVSVETQNALALRDREWLATDDRRWLGGSDGTASNLYLGGHVQAVSGTLPGLGSRTTAFIPTGANGKTATIADYAAATGTARYDAGNYLNALNEYKRQAAVLHAEYEFTPWAQAYADFMWSKNESAAPGDPVALSGYTLPAGYQGNPFGVPIRVYKYMWELGTPERHYTFEQRSTSIGLRGDLPRDWRYRLNLSDARSNPSLPEGVFQFYSPRMTALIAGSTPPVLLHDSYSLIGKEGSAPNAPGVLESAYFKDERYDQPINRTYSLSFDGPAWQLEAGPINMAVGVERRVDSVKFTNITDTTGVDTTQAAEPKQDRITDARYLEASVPLLSPKSSLRIPLVHSLSVTGAIRRDSYNDFGAASKKTLGGQYKPVSWMSLRATRNEAFRVPYLIDITRPRFVSNQTVPATGSSSFVDTYRKNEQVTGILPFTLGGNPNLKPEQSVHHNLGLQIESPFEATKGLSFSVDRWRSKILDRISTPSRQDLLLYFPEAFTRADLTPADAAAGYTAGKITAVDSTSRNIALYQASGYDYSVRFVRNTAYGEFSLNGRMTRTDKLQAIVTPGAAPSTSTDARLQPRRAVVSMAWAYRGAGVSLTGIQQAGFPVSISANPVMYPGTTTWNTNVWYDYGTGRWHDKDSLIGRLMQDTRISLGLINATDLAPPLSPTGTVNGSVDPRMMRYTFTLRRRF